jgi:hypothetical protein
MDERSGTVRLVESREESEGRSLVATVSRAEVEKALRAEEGPVDLLLDVERVAADGDGREHERVALAWEPQDLERLLATGTGDEISLTFDEEEFRRWLDADVEAHGMREKLAALTVVAGMAAAGAGGAAASVYGGHEGGGASATPSVTAPASEISTGLTSVPAPAATPSEISTGLGDRSQPTTAPPGRVAAPSEISTGIIGEPAAPPSEISTGIVQQPPTAPAEVTTGITAEPTATPVSDSPSWSPSPEAVALTAGMILALTAAGFAVRTQRRRPAHP